MDTLVPSTLASEDPIMSLTVFASFFTVTVCVAASYTYI